MARKAKDSVLLLDLNPFGPPATDGVLFDWDELREGEEANEADGPLFRFVKTDAGIQPNGMRQYSLPLDVVDLASGNDPHKLVDFLKLQQRMQDGEEEEEED